MDVTSLKLLGITVACKASSTFIVFCILIRDACDTNPVVN